MPVKQVFLFSLLGAALIAGCTSVSKGRRVSQSVFAPSNHSQMETFARSVRPVRGDILAKYDLARHFQRIRRHTVAIEALKEILQADPGHADAHNALGYSYDCIGDFRTARQHYRIAVALNPDLDYAYNNLGYSFILDREYSPAVAALEQAVALKPERKKYIKNLGYAYFKSGNPKMADAALRGLNDPAAAHRIKVRLGMVPETPDPPIRPVELPSAGAAAIEVSNGNGVLRMAGSVGNYLKRHGMRVARLTNADHFRHSRTVIYYRDGYLEAASEIERSLPGLSPGGHLVAAHLDGEPIRVLIGRDLVPYAATVYRDVDVDLTNGNGIDGLAGRLSRRLRREGFRVGRLSNADHFSFEKSVVFYGKGKAGQARLIASALPGGGRYRLIELSDSGMHVQVFMGADMID